MATIKEQRNFLVVKSNEMVRKARYNLSAFEQKTLAYIISKIRPDDTKIQNLTFTIQEYCQVCGIDYTSGGNYAYVKTKLKELADKSFWIKNENGKETLVRWLQKVTITEGSGIITVKLDEDIHKYVIGLYEGYTNYDLLSILPMKSNYSIRIFEFLKSYAFMDETITELDELKRILEADNYDNFKDFRVNVLDKAVKDINTYTDIYVEWRPIKTGRKVTLIKFIISRKDMWATLQAVQCAQTQIDGQLSLFD